MKIHLEKKYIQIGITMFLTAIAVMMVLFFIWKNDSIKASLKVINTAMAPVYYGLIIAYLISPILNWIEKKILIPLFGKLKWFEPEKDINRAKHIRSFSVVFTLIFVIFLLYLFFASVIPELIRSVQSIINQYPTYTKNLTAWTEKVLEDNPNISETMESLVSNFSSETDNWLNDYLLPAIKNLLPNVGDMLIGLSSSIVSFFKFLWNIVIGFIISIYVLSSKERFSQSCVRLCYAAFERNTANNIIEATRFTHHTFTGFLSGKIVDSVIIGLITFIVMSIAGWPYSILISIIIGVTNIIPFFGPLFGAVPSCVLLLMVNPKLALYFIIFIVILQQVDGNFIGPKILSQTTGVTTFWIIVSITIFSGIMGVIGMIIAVPVTGVIFALVDRLTNGWLIKKNLPTDPESYFSIGPINEAGDFTHYEYVKPLKKKKETKIEIALKKLYLNCKFYFKDKIYRRQEQRKGKKSN